MRRLSTLWRQKLCFMQCFDMFCLWLHIMNRFGLEIIWFGFCLCFVGHIDTQMYMVKTLAALAGHGRGGNTWTVNTESLNKFVVS